MGQKTNPIGFRLAVRRNWDSRWYANKKTFPELLKNDYEIRKFLHEKLRQAGVPTIFIERAGSRIRVKIYSAEIEKIAGREVILDIQEIKKPDLVAQLVAENIALQLERRVSFRRAMKKAVQSTMGMGAEGIRLRVAGRLGGAEIARVESSRVGRVPLHTLRANIDYGFAEAHTVYGKLGIKCWICTKEPEI